MRFLLVSNALTSAIAKLFHPIVYAVAWMLAAIYGVIPNYGVAIAILTVIIMALLTPLTVKSTRSMIAMQRLQPEIKRLQQKYKGPEHRQELQEEMMKLYREQGVNPASGCISGLLSAPFLIILYSVIRGLSNTVAVTKGKFSCPGYPLSVSKTFTGVISCPRDIPTSSSMYGHLVRAHPPGAMLTWGMNLALKPLSPHSSIWAALPFYAIIVIAVSLQYFQMAQLNRRNPNQNQLSNQMQTFQKVTPILFAYIYFIVPAAAAVYMIFSSIIRIVTQVAVFRFDRPKPPKPAERELPAAPEAPSAAASPPKSDGVKTDAKVTSPAGTSTNGASTKPAAKASPAAKQAQLPNHPRSRDKRKRKAR